MTDKLGRGFAFPMVPDGDFPLVDGADAVMQALYTLLSTEPGERVGAAVALRHVLTQGTTAEGALQRRLPGGLRLLGRVALLLGALGGVARPRSLRLLLLASLGRGARAAGAARVDVWVLARVA